MKRFLNYACWLFKDELPEVARLKKNWFILCCNSFVLGMSFAITYPSLHQFVTTPTTITATKDIRPGLGLSETFYSWSVSVYPIGEVVTGIIFSISAKYTSIKSLCCVDSLLLTLGGVFYGSAVNGPMVLLARICQGSFIGGLSLIVRVYLGETTNIAMKLRNEDPQKSQLKNNVFLIVFGISTVSVGLGPALTPIVAQFPSIDPFRWSGWVVATSGLLMLVINSLYFVERPWDINRKGTNFSLRKMQPAVPLYVLLVFLAGIFANGFGTSIVETLLNPFLGTNFGFNIETISYVVTATLVIFCLALVFVHVLQKCGVKNKDICIIGFVLGISGLVILADWQSLGGDPCDQYSYDKFNSSSYFQDHPYFQEDTHVNVSSWEGLCPSNSTEVCLSMEVCLNHSGPPEECFWNPKSRISGIFCEECEKLCRSWRTSLNFAQLIIGVVMFSLSFNMCKTVLSILISDGMGSEGQSLISGVVVLVGGIPKIVGPLGGNALFLAAGHRTYLPMLVLSSFLLLTLLPYLLLYRKLSPQPHSRARSVLAQEESALDDDIELLEKSEFDCEGQTDSIILEEDNRETQMFVEATEL